MLPMDRVRGIVARHFRVYDAREERLDASSKAQMFFLMYPAEEFDRRYEAVRDELRTLEPGLLVFMRHEGGEDVLFVTDRPAASMPKTRTHLILLGLTILTTMAAGATFWATYHASGPAGLKAIFLEPMNLVWGFVTFSLPLMTILGVHETAHGIAARRHGLRATLPYFIPVPPIIFLPIGTLGAFISMRDPMPDRKALFDIGASGPLAGFLVAVPVVIAGMWLTASIGIDLPDHGRPEVSIDVPAEVGHPAAGETTIRLLGPQAGHALLRITAPSDDWTYEAHARITTPSGQRTDTTTGRLDANETVLHRVEVPEGTTRAEITLTWDDKLIEFGDPLLVHIITWSGLDPGEHRTHPTFFAGWVGLLITGINLLPVGQLDGGHVARAVFGERMRWFAWGAMAALGVLVFFLQSAWFLMFILILFLGIQHPPPLNDRTRLDARRIVMAVVVLVVFALTFVPQPIVP